MRGMIIMWSGAIENIPSGYVLCDGNNGTPNLKDKFIVGAGNTYAVASTGGAVSHSHTFNAGNHKHDISSGKEISQVSGTLGPTTDNTEVSGTTDTESQLPPYYAIAFIMKT